VEEVKKEPLSCAETHTLQ